MRVEIQRASREERALPDCARYKWRVVVFTRVNGVEHRRYEVTVPTSKDARSTRKQFQHAWANYYGPYDDPLDEMQQEGRDYGPVGVDECLYYGCTGCPMCEDPCIREEYDVDEYDPDDFDGSDYAVERWL